MDKSLGPTILYLTDSNIHMQCKEKVQRKGIQSDAEPFNEYFFSWAAEVEFPM